MIRKLTQFTCNADDKEEVRRIVERTIDRLIEATQGLNLLHSRLNLMDVRHDDFRSDANLQEHTLSLQSMAKGLQEAVTSGGYLDQHFDRVLGEGE